MTSTAPSAVHPPLPNSYVLYEIVEACPPPTIDLGKALKHVLLPKRLLPTITRWQRHYTSLAGLLFIISTPLSCAVLFVPARIGRLLSVGSFALQVPLVFLGTLALRADVVRELLKTFDFWFFSFASTANVLVIAVYFADLRVLYMLTLWVGVQYNISIDAAVYDFHYIIGSVLMGLIYHTVAVVVVSFAITPDVNSFQMINYGFQVLKTEDFLITTISLTMYIHLRSAYRRTAMLYAKTKTNQAPTSFNSPSKLIRCVTYRCSVKLRPMRPPIASSNPPRTSSSLAPPTPMRFVPVDQVFESRHTFFPSPWTTSTPSPVLQKILHAIGLLGLAITAAMFVALNYLSKEYHYIAYPAPLRFATYAGLACTALYTLTIAGLYNPKLLKYLCLSFDFAFIAGQFVTAHVFAAYVFHWDLRSCVLIASFLWVMLAVTIDALTPVVRQRIGFNMGFVALVLFCSVGAHIMLCRELAARHSDWRMRSDAILAFSFFGRDSVLHMLPAFFNLMWMLVMWELRALYRVLKATRHDLVIIHGVVDLDMSCRGAKRQVLPQAPPGPARARIVPAPQTGC